MQPFDPQYIIEKVEDRKRLSHCDLSDIACFLSSRLWHIGENITLIQSIINHYPELIFNLLAINDERRTIQHYISMAILSPWSGCSVHQCDLNRAKRMPGLPVKNVITACKAVRAFGPWDIYVVDRVIEILNHCDVPIEQCYCILDSIYDNSTRLLINHFQIMEVCGWIYENSAEQYKKIMNHWFSDFKTELWEKDPWLKTRPGIFTEHGIDNYKCIRQIKIDLSHPRIRGCGIFLISQKDSCGSGLIKSISK